MASPFPGMDPYLEGEMWQEFHDTLAHQLRSQLLTVLPPKYVALLAKRYVLDWPALGIVDVPPRTFYPDVHVAAQPQGAAAAPAIAGVVAERTLTPPTLTVMEPDPAPHLAVEVRDVAQRRLVTVIEIFSPANKIASGLADYLAQRRELTQTETHLLELDLLRQGIRLFADIVPPADYYVYLSRAQHRPAVRVWALALRERLPVVPVPLLPPDPDVTLDLQAAVDTCFALVGYERLLDYDAPPPPPPLSAEQEAWARERVAAWRGQRVERQSSGS